MPMNELSYEQLKGIDSQYEKGIAESPDYGKSIEMRSARGGTSKSRVPEQIKVQKAMFGLKAITKRQFFLALEGYWIL